MLENFDISKLDLNEISLGNDYKFLPLVARNNYSLSLCALNANTNNYLYIGDELKDNEDLALKVLAKNHYFYQNLSEKLKNNPVIFEKFIQQSFYADNLEDFQFGPDVAKDKSLMIRFIEKLERNRYPDFLNMLDNSLLYDKEILFLAIDKNAQSYNDFPIEMKTKNFCLELFKKNTYVFNYFEEELLSDVDFTVQMIQFILDTRKNQIFFNYVTHALPFIKKLSQFHPLIKEIAQEHNIIHDSPLSSINKIADTPQLSLQIIDDTFLMSIKKLEAYQLSQLMKDDINLLPLNQDYLSKNIKPNKF